MKRLIYSLLFIALCMLLTSCEVMFDMESKDYSLSYFNDCVSINGFKDGVYTNDLLIESQVEYLCPRHNKTESHTVDRINFNAFENQNLMKLAFDSKMGYLDILDYAFSGNEDMTLTQFPSTISGIGNFTFYNCHKINDLQLPNVLDLGESAFENCSSLDKILIGEKIRFIGDNCFKNCNDNLVLTLLTPSPPEVGKNVFDGIDSLTIRIPKDYLNAYINDDNWSIYQNSFFVIE